MASPLAPSNDIERATNLAHRMVTKWVCRKIRATALRRDRIRHSWHWHAHYSGATSKLIDEETRRIIDDCYGRAKRILEENRDILEAMKDALMEYETIDSRTSRRPDGPPQSSPPTGLVRRRFWRSQTLVQRQQKSATLFGQRPNQRGVSRPISI